jgi:hypothetical protein
MSEKIYAWLLRLYPSGFRDAYGDDAMQLFRDRSRDEPGFFRQLKLWLDLLADLAVSVPRQYSYLQPALSGASLPLGSSGIPAFQILEPAWPRFSAMLLGGVLSLAGVGAWILIGHVLDHRLPGGAAAYVQWSTLSRVAQRDAAVTSPTGRGVAGDVKLNAAERRRVIQAAITNLK